MQFREGNIMRLNTFSIIARCKETGLFGAAVASKFPGVGAFSPYIEAQAGVIATQGWVNPSLGPKGIGMLRDGATANEVLNAMLFQDPGRELRQIAIMDRFGNSTVYTGSENDDAKGHIIGDQFCIQGNLLTDLDVLKDMEEAYKQADGPLAERLLTAMIAGDERGGDKRGKQSAVIKVEAIQSFPFVDFRVDDHPEPIRELQRIYLENKDVLIDKYYEWVDSVKKGIRLGETGELL
jgi:uncharacterized Ntn-hydrolase superfamily protein